MDIFQEISIAIQEGSSSRVKEMLIKSSKMPIKKHYDEFSNSFLELRF